MVHYRLRPRGEAGRRGPRPSTGAGLPLRKPDPGPCCRGGETGLRRPIRCRALRGPPGIRCPTLRVPVHGHR
eukprot:4011832-Pyramimonas_sp.AAC.1